MWVCHLAALRIIGVENQAFESFEASMRERDAVCTVQLFWGFCFIVDTPSDLRAFYHPHCMPTSIVSWHSFPMYGITTD